MYSRNIMLISDASDHYNRVLAQALRARSFRVSEYDLHQNDFSQPPDISKISVVLLEANSGDERAIALLRVLREASPSIKLICFADISFPDDANACRELGADAFLLKPIELSQL